MKNRQLNAFDCSINRTVYRGLPVALTKKRQHELEHARVSRFFGPGQLPSSQKDPWVIHSGLGVFRDVRRQ
jgi:hypothetical protein